MPKKYEKQTDLPPRSDPNYMKMYRQKHKERLSLQQKAWVGNLLSNNPSYWKDTYDALQAKQYREDNKKQLAEKKWRRSGIVDITYEKYIADLQLQENLCKICNRYMELPQADHNHTTGQYRALLCVSCNMGLGIYEKNKNNFENYLKNFSTMIEL